jgi:hypothetical protein
VTVVLVWLAGLAAAFVGVLAATARYGCSAGDTGLACRRSGSILAVLLVLAVLAVVVTVTLLSTARSARPVVILGLAGFAVLAVCFALALLLLGTA